jgi:hypothetical protein
MIQAIPTTYKGTRFRSRLEARWAAFFDLISWRWLYEPIDEGGWIPDFVLPDTFDQRLLIEVKPSLTQVELQQHEARINRARPCDPALLLGGNFDILRMAHPSCPWRPAALRWCLRCKRWVPHDDPRFPTICCAHSRLTDDRLRLSTFWSSAGADVQWRPR